MKGGLSLLNLAGSMGTAIAAATLLLAPTLGAQQVFRAGTQAVLVDVLVTDRNRPVAGLTTADFELRDNGVRQTIDSVSIPWYRRTASATHHHHRTVLLRGYPGTRRT